jgi:hypothetical protein
MLIIAKIALGMASTVALATVYTFREGVIRVDVDEHRDGGSHVHFFVPAAAVPMAVHFTPQRHKEHAAEHMQDWMPMLRQLSKGLEKYPNAEFVDVQSEEEHVSVRTHAGKLQVDVTGPGESVHVACPIATIEDLAEEFGANRPGA